MITRIEAVNYKCLRNVSQVLDRFHVLTGPNGSGKSTFLEVPRLLGAFAQEGLEQLWETARANSLDELLFRGEGLSFQLAIQAQPPDELLNGTAKSRRFLRYELEVGWKRKVVKSTPPKILAEQLWLTPKNSFAKREVLVHDADEFPSRSWPQRRILRSHRGGNQKPLLDWVRVAWKTEKSSYFRAENGRWNLQIRNPADKSALSTLPEDADRFRLANWFKRELVRTVQHIELRGEAMRYPCSPLKSERFAPDGSNLPQVLRSLKKHLPTWRAWLGHLHTILPVADVAIHERPEDRKQFITLEYDQGHTVPAWHLSDGTLRVIALTALAYHQKSGLTLIEEPENGVHPQAVEGIFQALSNVRDGQVLMATHSPVVVAQTLPPQLLCFGMSDRGETDILRGDEHPRLVDWQGEVQLSRLFAAGILS